MACNINQFLHKLVMASKQRLVNAARGLLTSGMVCAHHLVIVGRGML